MSRVPLRLRLVDVVARRFDEPVADLDADGIARRRRLTRHSRLVRRLTGPILPTVSIEDLAIPVRDGRRVGLRVYRPAAIRAGRPLPVLVFFHGGGWVFGSPASYDPLCTFLCDGVEAVVASIDYRLAPEHPAPAGLEDGFDGLRWVAEHAADLGGDPSRIGVAGDSAGGNIAAVCTQLARDAGGPALAHQALIYPSVDSTCLTRSKIERANGPILRRRDTDAYFALYLGSGATRLDPADPLVSPLQGDLRGLPPALVQTAGLDPLRDEGAAYAHALHRAGVEVVHTDYPRAAHGFASFPGLSVGAWPHREELVLHMRAHLRPRPGAGREAVSRAAGGGRDRVRRPG